MEQAVSLIHQAKSASGEQRDSLLERLLTLLRGSAAALAEELLPVVLELQEDEQWRSFIPRFVEACCAMRPSLMLLATETLLSLARDTDVDVLVALIQCVARLYGTMLTLCTNVEDSEVPESELADMWKEWTDMVKSATRMVSHTDTRVCTSAIKFVEISTIVLTNTDDSDSADSLEGNPSSSGWTLDGVPALHPVVDAASLKQQGADNVELLASIAKGSQPLAVVLVALNCLGRVSRKRTHLLSVTEPHLGIALTMQRPDSPKQHVVCIHATIRSIFLGLLKLPSCAAYAAVLGEHLHSLGADMWAEAARRQMEKARVMAHRARAGKRSAGGGMSGSAPMSGQKRARSGAEGSQGVLVGIKDRLTLDRPLEEWPAQMVAELIVAAMPNYPPALPPHLIDVADTPFQMWPQRLAFPSLGAKQQQTEEGEGEVVRTGAAETMRNKVLSQSRPLKKETVRRFASEAIGRLLAGGEDAGWGHSYSVLARLLAGGEGGEEEGKMVVDHVLENYGERQDLAIEWIHQLYIAEVRREGSGAGKKGGKGKEAVLGWEWVLNTLLDGLVDAARAKVAKKESGAAEVGVEQQRYLTRLIAETPCVGEAVIELVTGMCEGDDKAVRGLGLACLRALVYNHDRWKRGCLEKLLGYTSSVDETLRAPAIRLVCGKQFEALKVSKEIEEEAVANLRRACRLDEKESMQVEGEAPAGLDRPKIHLFLSLCAQKPRLLSKLLEAYLESSAPIRTGIHATISDMIRAIGPTSKELQEMMEECPAGSEVLILAFVATLTEGGAAHPQLVATIQSLYARKKDARFMIYIISSLPSDELHSVLPAIVALPSVGVKAALKRLLHANPAPITPEKLIVALHKLETTKTLTVRKIAEAIEVCFLEKTVFTTQVLAVVLQQLVDQRPIPVLYMRTVLLSLKISPTLSNFVIGILHRLVAKEVWEIPQLWEGFVKCCRQTQPRSNEILLQLPPNRLADALSQSKDLADLLHKYILQQQSRGVQIPATLTSVVSKAASSQAGEASADDGDDGVKQ